MQFLRRLHLLALLLLPPYVQASYGQEADIRLSPKDKGYRMLSASIFQFADSSQGKVAVVWGTTVREGGTPGTAAYVQVIGNGATLGPALRIGQGELGSRIRIAPLEGNFLILYYSDAPGERHGTWSQLLRLSPYRLEPPHRIDTALTLNGNGDRRQVWTIGGTSGERRILWYDYGAPGATTPGLYSCPISADGIPGPAELYGTSRSDLLTYRTLPGLMLIQEPDSASHIIHLGTGKLDARPLPRLRGPFHIGPDTSLTILSDSTLRVYPSIFDTTIAISGTLPLSAWGASPQQALVSRDKDGLPLLYLAIGQSGELEKARRPRYTVLRIKLDQHLAPRTTDTVFSDSIVMTATALDEVLGYTRSVSCDDRWRIAITFGKHDGSSSYNRYVEMDEDGIRSSSVEEFPRCGERAAISVLRIQSDSASVVEVRAPGPITLSAPLDPTASPARHLSPAVLARPSGIFCTWQEADTSTSNVLASWAQERDSVSELSVYTPPSIAGEGGGLYMIPQPAVAFSEGSADRMVAFPGMAALEYNYNYTADVKGYYGTGRVRGSRFALACPGDDGWKTMGVIRAINQWLTPPYSLTIITGKVLGYDPGERSILMGFNADPSGFLVFTWSFPITEIRGYNVDDDTYWSINPANLSFQSLLIPMGKRRYVRFDDAHGTYMEGTQTMATFTIPTAGRINRRFFKLLGPTFAMTSWSDTGAPRFSIEVFDTAGNRRSARTVERPAATNDYTLVQSPTDSMIAILFGGGNGLHATLLNGDLGVIAADTLLSQGVARVSAPNGAFRNDTLFMVWEDYRETQSRIYGTRARLRSMPAAGIEEGALPGRAEGLRFYPNPTAGVITIEGSFDDAGETTIDLVTPLGQRVVARTLVAGRGGDRFATLDLGDLPAGVYIARVRQGERAWVEKIVKR